MFLVPLFTNGQTKYIAAYEQKIQFDFSNTKIKKSIGFKRDKNDTISAAIKDSLINELYNGDLLGKLLKEMMGDEATMYYHLRAGDSTAELEYSSNKKQIVNRTTKKFIEGEWKAFNEETGTYAVDSVKQEWDFVYTGEVRTQLGYTCHEARSTDTARTITIWVCKELPPTISPGITIKSIGRAIFEYDDKPNKRHIVLRSIQKLNQ